MSKPFQRPEGVLLERLRNESQPKLSVRAAAKAAGISGSRWTQIVNGYKQETKDVRIPVRGPAETLARMARTVGATPVQLREAGRDDAAGELEQMMTVRERVLYERAGGALTASIPGLGPGLARLIPAETASDYASVEDPLAVLETLVEDGWETARSLTEAVVAANPSDELLEAARAAVHFIDSYLIIRILNSGLAAEMEKWLARIYSEREVFYRRLSRGEPRFPWFTGQSKEKKDDLEDETQSDAPGQAREDQEEVSVSNDAQDRLIAGGVGTSPLPPDDPTVDGREDGHEGEDLTG